MRRTSGVGVDINIIICPMSQKMVPAGYGVEFTYRMKAAE